MNFKISRMKEVIKATKPHGHKSYFEIIFLSQGAGWHHIDLQKFQVNPNSIYFIQPGQVHCWEFTEVPKGFVLMFRHDFLLKYNIDENLIMNLPYFLNGHVLNGEEAADLSDLFYRIEKEFAAPPQPDAESILAAYLQVISLKLKRLVSPDHGNFPSSPPEKFRQFKLFLDEHIISKRQVKDYAELLHITPKHLNDICRKTINRTASDLIQEKILLDAKKLLLHTNNSVSEIAYQLKFHDTSHFAKFFRKYAGLAPGEYLANMK